jgi:hypothetical protein
MAGNRTFQTRSGEVLKLRPISEITLVSAARQLKVMRPSPPVETVETQSGPVEIANEAHPEYLNALEDFEPLQSMFMVAFYIQFGVFAKLTDEQLEDVKDLQAKKEMVSPGAPENQFLTYLYVTTICTGWGELNELVNAIEALSTPTAEQVQAHLDTFRPGVQGAAATENKNAFVGTRVAVR